jgi:outer membrane protein, heavy metal efflux system
VINHVLLKRQQQLVKSENELLKAAVELSLFYRDDNGVPITPAENSLPSFVAKCSNPPEAVNLENLVKKAYAIRPEILILLAETARSKIEQTLGQNLLDPRLDLQALTARDYGSGDKSLDETELKLGVKLEVPLELRKGQGRTAVAIAKQRELDQKLIFSRQKIQAEVQKSLLSLELAKTKAELAHQELIAARELQEGEKIRLLNGDSNLIFLNLREQTAAEAAISEIESRMECQSAMAQFDASLGKY